MMELKIAKGQEDQLLEDIQLARAEGKIWAAFNTISMAPLGSFDIHYFETQGEAEEFAETLNLAFDDPDQELPATYWEYVTLPDLQSFVLGIPESYLNLDVSVTDIMDLLTAQQLQLVPGHSPEELLDSFQDGLVYPLRWRRTIDPREEISEFHIVQHRHDGGLVYEHGHSHRLAGSYENYQEAKNALAALLAQSVLEKDGTDHLLVGQYRGQELELDMEGQPSAHTGLLLETAYWQWDTELKASRFSQLEVHRLDRPAEIKKYFFGRYDRAAGVIRLLNDRLEPVDPFTAKPGLCPIYYKNDLLTTKNAKLMLNQSSYEYNAEMLLNLGFGEEIRVPLREKMEAGEEEFTLVHSREFGKDKVESVLHFSKGDDKEKDLTFFNRYDATLKKDGMEDLTQTFFVGKKYNYTLQERYNMMDGRSAYREQPKMVPTAGEEGLQKMVPTGETYWAWRGLNFKEADNYGNFLPKVVFWDHEKELQKYPIKAIDEKYDRTRIMRPLEKGNQVQVMLVRDGQETPAIVVANPRMMRLDFYDTDGQSLIVRKVARQLVEETQKTEQSPQQIRQEAIARGEAQKVSGQNGQEPAAQGQADTVKQHQGEAPQAGQTETSSKAQSQQEGAKQDTAAEQKNNQSQGRRRGVHV